MPKDCWGQAVRGTYILCPPQELVRGGHSGLLFTGRTSALDGEQCCVPGTRAGVFDTCKSFV